jgi:hypothetical protein
MPHPTVGGTWASVTPTASPVSQNGCSPNSNWPRRRGIDPDGCWSCRLGSKRGQESSDIPLIMYLSLSQRGARSFAKGRSGYHHGFNPRGVPGECHVSQSVSVGERVPQSSRAAERKLPSGGRRRSEGRAGSRVGFAQCSRIAWRMPCWGVGSRFHCPVDEVQCNGVSCLSG